MWNSFYFKTKNLILEFNLFIDVNLPKDFLKFVNLFIQYETDAMLQSCHENEELTKVISFSIIAT